MLFLIPVFLTPCSPILRSCSAQRFIVTVVLAFVSIVTASTEDRGLLGPALPEKLVELINSLDVGWTADAERFQEISLQEAKTLCGLRPSLVPDDFAIIGYGATTAGLPAEYDVRTEWGDRCPSLHMIYDQAQCGSCWAVSTATVITDRTCMARNGSINPILSAGDLLSCCGRWKCGSCSGGYMSGALQYWTQSGVVTGGFNGDKSTCKPYPFPGCNRDPNNAAASVQCNGLNSGKQYTAPACTRTCNGNTSLAYTQDKWIGKSTYKLTQDATAIMSEIYQNGPVIAGFMVYQDLLSYKSGVYQHVSGSKLGGHAVRIVGWGTDSGKPYWTIANSWVRDLN